MPRTFFVVHYFLVCTGLVCLNVFLSVLIVLLNKQIYTHHGVPNVTLTCLHFLVMTVCVLVCELVGVFHRKSLPIMDVLPLSLTFCAFVVFTNISLQTNSVAAYLVFKMAITPTVVALEAFWCSRKVPNDVLLTLVSNRLYCSNRPMLLILFCTCTLTFYHRSCVSAHNFIAVAP